LRSRRPVEAADPKARRRDEPNGALEQPRAGRALRRRHDPAPRGHGAAWRATSLCPRRGGWADQRDGGTLMPKPRRNAAGQDAPAGNYFVSHAVSALTQPAGRHARLARLFFDSSDGVLVVFDALPQPAELSDRFVAILSD